MRNMNARMRRMSYRQQAAHRGKDDPQVSPGELASEEDGPVGRPDRRPVPGAVAEPGDATDTDDPGDRRGSARPRADAG